jgi:hypothetical protein
VYDLSIDMTCTSEDSHCPGWVNMRLFLGKARHVLCWPAVGGDCDDVEPTMNGDTLLIEGDHSLNGTPNRWNELETIEVLSLSLTHTAAGVEVAFVGTAYSSEYLDEGWRLELTGIGTALLDREGPGLWLASKATENLFGLDPIVLHAKEPILCDGISSTVICGARQVSVSVLSECDTGVAFIEGTTQDFQIVPQELWPMSACTAEVEGLTDIAGNVSAPVGIDFEIPDISSNENLNFEANAESSWIANDCELTHSAHFLSSETEFDLVAPDGYQMAVCTDGGSLGGALTVPQGMTQLSFVLAAGNDCFMSTKPVPFRVVALTDAGTQVLLEEDVESIVLPEGPDPQGAQHFTPRTVTLPVGASSVVLQFVNGANGPYGTDEGTCVAWLAIDDLLFFK